MDFSLAQPYTLDQANVRASNQLLVNLRASLFRLQPNLAPNSSLLIQALDELAQAKAEKLQRWFHIKIHLPHNLPEGDYEQPLRVCQQKWVLQGAFVFEKVNKDGTMGHPHIHLLCESSKCAGHIRRDISQSLDIPSNQIHIIPVGTTTQRRHTANYICKNRTYDVAWREGHGLDQVYLVNLLPEDFEKIKHKS